MNAATARLITLVLAATCGVLVLGCQGAGQAVGHAQVSGPVGQVALSDLPGVVRLPGGKRGFDAAA